MRYKAYINSAKKVAIAEYRDGFIPENKTFATCEDALISLAQKLTERALPDGFTIRKCNPIGYARDGSELIEIIAKKVAKSGNETK